MKCGKVGDVKLDVVKKGILSRKGSLNSFKSTEKAKDVNRHVDIKRRAERPLNRTVALKVRITNVLSA